MGWELLSEVNLENLTVNCSYSQLIQDWLQSYNYQQRANYEWQYIDSNIPWCILHSSMLGIKNRLY